jgi:hypothetical protein
MKTYINYNTNKQLCIFYDNVLMREVYLILSDDTTTLLYDKKNAKALWKEFY